MCYSLHQDGESREDERMAKDKTSMDVFMESNKETRLKTLNDMREAYLSHELNRETYSQYLLAECDMDDCIFNVT